MSGIGIISNPKSKQNRKHPEKMHNLAYLVGPKGEAKETRTFDDLYRVVEDFHRAKIDIIGINGGDGSLHVACRRQDKGESNGTATGIRTPVT